MRTAQEWLAAVLFAGLTASAVYWQIRRARRGTSDRERQRCRLVNVRGRMIDANITDVGDNLIFYTYLVRGVEYNTCQDVSPYSDMLPNDLGSLIGPATVKYLPRDPSNSIVIGEGWMGFRKQVGPSLQKGA